MKWVLKPSLILWLLTTFLICSCNSCSNPKTFDRQKVSSLLEKREKALKTLNPDEIFTLYDASYAAKYYSLEELKAMAASSGPRITKLNISFTERQIFPPDEDGSVTVVHTYDVKGKVGTIEMAYKNKEGMSLKPGPDTSMLITKGDEVMDIISYRMVQEADIMETLQKRRKAIETRNPEVYMSVVSDAYKDPRGDKTSLDEWIRELMNGEGLAMLRISDARIYLERNKAVAEEPWKLIALDTGEQVEKGLQGITLAREDNRWKITGGLRK